MKSKIGTILMISGAMLIAAALSLAVYNINNDKKAGSYSEKILESLESELPKLQTSSADLSDSSQTKIEMETVTIENNNYAGIIDIPFLNLKLPVMSEWNYDNLKLAPCRYKGSAAEGSLIIAAHNYNSHFGNINELSRGDEVYFIDVNGVVYSYSVAETELLDGSASDEMESGQWALTLFTCNFDGSERVTVRCERN